MHGCRFLALGQCWAKLGNAKKQRTNRTDIPTALRKRNTSPTQAFVMTAANTNHEPSDPYYRRQGAGMGDLVFLQKGEQRTLATVLSFDNYDYMLALHRAPRYKDDARWSDTIVLVDTGRVGGNDGWSNTRLPTCCVCLAADADFALDCRCTVPGLCVLCAPRLHACPQCRQPNASYVEDNNARAGGSDTGLQSNIYAIEPSREVRRFSFNIKGIRGETRQIVVCGAWNVRTLRKVVSNSLGYFAERMIYRGKQLDDRAVVDAYNLQKEDIMHVVMRLCGD